MLKENGLFADEKKILSVFVKNRPPEIRFLNEMRTVIYDRAWFQKIKNPEMTAVYFVYRGLKRQKNLRYDITAIPGRMLGREFPKTKGHRHCQRIVELIQILSGKAFLFCQKGKENLVKDCYAVALKKGESVEIPAGYEHLVINPSKKTLIFGNWVSLKAQNDYSLFEQYQGASHYYTRKGWVKNKNYKKAPELKFQKPTKCDTNIRIKCDANIRMHTNDTNQTRCQYTN